MNTEHALTSSPGLERAYTFTFEETVVIDAPPEDVWRIVADYARDDDWRAGVSMRHEPEGLVREGTVTYETLRAFGATHEVVAEIHDVEEGRSFRFRSTRAKMPVRGQRSVEAHERGTLFRDRIELELTGVHSFFSAPLGWLFRRRLATDLRSLKALCERASAAGRSGETFVTP